MQSRNELWQRAGELRERADSLRATGEGADADHAVDCELEAEEIEYALAAGHWPPDA